MQAILHLDGVMATYGMASDNLSYAQGHFLQVIFICKNGLQSIIEGTESLQHPYLGYQIYMLL